MRRHLLVPLLAATTLLVACSGGDDDSTATSAAPAEGSTTPSTEPPASTTPASTSPAPTAAPTIEVPVELLDEPGPFPVGVTTLALASGNPVEVWYPTTAPATGTIDYDVRDFVPPAVRDLLTADIPAGYSTPGTRDGTVADGRFPLVLFSHGFSGIRMQSTFLTAHLASHGMIVAAPEHPSRDLAASLSQTASTDRQLAVDDILQTLDLLTAADATDTTAEGPFTGRVDTDRVAVVGHSAGGFTAATAASDPRIDGYVSMASGGPGDGVVVPDLPTLFLAGTTDAVVPAATVTRPAFDDAVAPSWYLELAATGHNAFDDFCTFGNGSGIIGIAEASGLGPVLDAQPELRALGEDGCVPPAAAVDQAFPLIRHATTAFVRFVFGDGSAPTFGAELGGISPLAVTVESR